MPRGYIKQYAPFPNVVVEGFPRMRCHVISATGANGSVALLTTKSSQATTITYVSEGFYTVTFPAGGTGAVGFIVPSMPQVTSTSTLTAGQVMTSVDSDTVNYVTGTAQIQSMNFDATPAIQDIIGDFSVLVFVIEDPLVTNA